MDKNESNRSRKELSWNQYWTGMATGGGIAVGGANHQLLDEFWCGVFASIETERGPTRVLDIASGDGAVLAIAMDILGPESIEANCLDISRHAVELVQRRFPATAGIVASALRIPCESASFDIVTCQFGLEYAGVAAFPEAARLVAPGGQLALLAHNRGGAIYRECSASVAAVDELKACDFIALSSKLFETGFATLQGADRVPYDRAAENLLPAYRELENILQRYGKHVAGDTLLRLYEDVDGIHQQMERYEPKEILGWLTKLGTEVDNYGRIMSSMRDSALGDQDFHAVCDEIEGLGFRALHKQPLFDDDLGLPIAWSLLAVR